MSAPAPKSRPSVLRRLTVVLATTLVALVLLEVGWRVFMPRSEYRMWTTRIAWAGDTIEVTKGGGRLLRVQQPAPELAGIRGVFRPGVEFALCYDLAGREPWGSMDAEGCVTTTINAEGFRGDFPPRERVPGRKRIVVVGDSMTFGHGVGDGQAWPFMLNEVDPNDTPLEVVNLAAPGYDVRDCAIALDGVGLGFQPDLVLYGFYQNDLFVGSELGMQAGLGGGPGGEQVNLEDGPVGWSRVIDSLKSAASRREKSARIQSIYAQLVAEGSEDFEAWKEPFLQMASSAKRAGVPFALVLIPELTNLENEPEDLPLAGVYDRVREVCAEADVPVVEVFGAWQGLSASDLWVHPLDHHPGPDAHAAAAEWILPQLDRWLR